MFRVELDVTGQTVLVFRLVRSQERDRDDGTSFEANEFNEGSFYSVLY